MVSEVISIGRNTGSSLKIGCCIVGTCFFFSFDGVRTVNTRFLISHPIVISIYRHHRNRPTLWQILPEYDTPHRTRHNGLLFHFTLFITIWAATLLRKTVLYSAVNRVSLLRCCRPLQDHNCFRHECYTATLAVSKCLKILYRSLVRFNVSRFVIQNPFEHGRTKLLNHLRSHFFNALTV
jgi:hypothetical protein